MRSPAVAGKFYSGEGARLRKQVEDCFLHGLGPGKLPKKLGDRRNIAGAVVPHAGYMYSGMEASHVYFELAKQKKPETIVILGPNHSGAGSAVALSKEVWQTPLGKVSTDVASAEFLLKNSNIFSLDERAHQFEHSIEVQLPFLQYIYGEFKFVPVAMGAYDLDTCLEIASQIARLEDALIIASSDFTHYESSDAASKKDRAAIEHILSLDEKKFLQTVYEMDISICGYGPIAVCIAAVKSMGSKKGELLKYATSGDVTGDYSSVVAYAAIVFRK